MLIILGEYEPLNGPQNPFFRCVICLYFLSFFIKHPVLTASNNFMPLCLTVPVTIFLKVWHGKSGVQLLSNEMVVVGGLSWHHKLPYLAVGGDRDVQLYKISY